MPRPRERHRTARRNPCTAEDGTRVEIPPPKINRGLLYWSGDPEPPRSPAGVPASRRTPCRFQTRALWRAVRIATIVHTPLQHTAGVFLCAIVSPPQQLRALPIGCRSRCFLHHNLPAATTRSQVPGTIRTTAVFARPPPQRIFAAPGYGPTPGHNKIRSTRLRPAARA